jgi:hypothetical protein
MDAAVIERDSSGLTRKADMSALAIAFFRACLYDIALCRDDLDERVLRRWEQILRGGEVRDHSITRYFRAFVEAKRRLRNPENIAAYLIYKLSHGAHPDRPAEEAERPEPGAHRCIACSAPVDEGRRRHMVERISRGYRLKDLKTPLDCEELVATHLTQEEICQFVGHEVSFSYQEKLIRRIYEELEYEEMKSHL